MAAIGTLVLPDGNTPPNNVTFYPIRPQQGNTPALWKTRESVALASQEITQRVLQSSSRTNVTSKISIPILEIVPEGCCTADIPKVAFTDICNIDIGFPLKSELADRQDMISFIRAYVNSSVFENAALHFEQVW